MSADALAQFPLSLLAAALALALLAGLIKGMVGFAMPMILIAGLGSFLDPMTALAGLILPTVVTNFWQALRQGITPAMDSAKTHWRFIVTLLVLIAASAQLVPVLPAAALFLALGLTVTFFAALQLLGWRPIVRPERRRVTEVSVGAFAGLIGGVSGVWGPPTVLYLTAMSTPKIEHMRVQGVVYSLGAVTLVFAHLKSGVLTAQSLPFSTLLLIPALAGLWIGFRLQDRLDQERFRRATLIVLVVAGLNLVRRGLMG